MPDAIIIDDEINNIENLVILLDKYCQQITVVGNATSVNEGLQLIKSTNPSIVFLDIQMPDKTGFDLLKAIRVPDFEVIFVTAFDQYAIQAIRFSAIDYLLKPINIEELKNAVDKAITNSKRKMHNERLENLVHLLDNRKQFKIAIPGNKEIVFTDPETIVYCQADNNYTFLFDQEKKKYISTKPIFEYEELLTLYGFIRCHQSYLVNKKFIKSWIKSGGDRLLLEGGVEIPISRNKKSKLKYEIGLMK